MTDKVTAKSISDDSILGTGVSCLWKTIPEKIFRWYREVIVNNCMNYSLFSVSCCRKKSNDTLYLSSSELKAASIDNIGQIEIYFYVYDRFYYETVMKLIVLL